MKAIQVSIFVIIMLMVQCVSANEKYKCAIQEKEKPLYCVSILQLLGSPEDYNNKRVLIIGFLNMEFESSAIYFHQEDSENMITANAIWINAEKPDFNRVYVHLEGTFLSGNRGHFGAFSGELIDISRINKIITKDELTEIKKRMKSLLENRDN